MSEGGPPIQSYVDPTAVARIAALRLARMGEDGDEKLGILRRLARQYIDCNLPKEVETRVEQSFNEQLFAKVFDYRTLLSHGGVPYHLRPKNYVAGRYDDFSLGLFAADSSGPVVASAELKGANVDLDAPQTGRKNKRTPVKQALAASPNTAECRWTLVSNFRELRLYERSTKRLLARADLLRIRDRRQLAMLLAHFDRAALLGTYGNGELMSALDSDHPSSPLPSADNAWRLVVRFTPTQDMQLPLHVMEQTLFGLLRNTEFAFVGELDSDLDEQPFALRLLDGWCSVDTPSAALKKGKFSCRFALSTAGQVQLTIRSAEAESQRISFDTLRHTLKFGMNVTQRLVNACHQKSVVGSGTGDGMKGVLGAELRDVSERQLVVGDVKRWIVDDWNHGVALAERLPVADSSWHTGTNQPRGLPRAFADCLSELCVQFRDRGRGIHVSRAAAEAYAGSE